jgi:ribosome biogenesis protein MAK21
MESVQAMKASMPKAEGDEEVDDDDDDDDDDDSRIESSVHASDSDEHASSDTEGDQEELRDAEDDDSVDWEFDGVGLSSPTDAEDADDLVTSGLGPRLKLGLQCMNRPDLPRRSHPF